MTDILHSNHHPYNISLIRTDIKLCTTICISTGAQTYHINGIQAIDSTRSFASESVVANSNTKTKAILEANSTIDWITNCEAEPRQAQAATTTEASN
jgi:hypothetical protein